MCFPNTAHNTCEYNCWPWENYCNSWIYFSRSRLSWTSYSHLSSKARNTTFAYQTISPNSSLTEKKIFGWEKKKRIDEGINKVCSAVHQTLNTSYYTIFTACYDIVYVYAHDCRSDARLREFKQLPQSLCLSNFCYGILFLPSLQRQDSIH